MRVKVTSAQLRALTAVRDGKVFHQFDNSHDTYHGPPAIGGRSLRGLAANGLIADSAQRSIKWLVVVLTAEGAAALSDPANRNRT